MIQGNNQAGWASIHSPSGPYFDFTCRSMRENPRRNPQPTWEKSSRRDAQGRGET